MITKDQIVEALHEVPDPEMPISIVDLGLVERVDLDDGRVKITLLPTFVGCPALDMIANDVKVKLRELGLAEDAEVEYVFDPAWTVDRITDAGRASLAEHGVTVPARCSSAAAVTVKLSTSAVPCPFCESRSTHLESPFGPTRCRMIYYCEACKNTFEHMKRLASE